MFYFLTASFVKIGQLDLGVLNDNLLYYICGFAGHHGFPCTVVY